MTAAAKRTVGIEAILPANVVAVESLGDPVLATLFPQEQALVGKAVDKRRSEFAAGRVCARRALARLGFPPAPILSGPRGEPQWPLGVVGSITHCAGYRAAAVATAAEVATIGIDATPHAALPAGVLNVISLPIERAWVEELTGTAPGVRWDRLLFSAKESVYKAWFPPTRCPLNFIDAIVTVDPVRQTFAARLHVSRTLVDGRRLAVLAGRWHIEGDVMLTAISVPAASGSWVVARSGLES